MSTVSEGSSTSWGAYVGDLVGGEGEMRGRDGELGEGGEGRDVGVGCRSGREEWERGVGGREGWKGGMKGGEGEGREGGREGWLEGGRVRGRRGGM